MPPSAWDGCCCRTGGREVLAARLGISGRAVTAIDRGGDTARGARARDTKSGSYRNAAGDRRSGRDRRLSPTSLRTRAGVLWARRRQRPAHGSGHSERHPGRLRRRSVGWGGGPAKATSISLYRAHEDTIADPPCDYRAMWLPHHAGSRAVAHVPPARPSAPRRVGSRTLPFPARCRTHHAHPASRVPTNKVSLNNPSF